MSYIKFIKIGLIGLALASCATHTHSGNYLSKYQQAVARYEAKDYYEALQLFKEVIPMLKGRKEIIPAQFYQAYAYFYQKSYKMSAYCFESFYKTYPRLAQAEEALYMQGYSLYLSIPDIRLDQAVTEKALKTLQTYLNKYPYGTYQQEAHQYNDELQNKLMLKYFRAAKLYYELGHYKAAVVALGNFREKYPESIYQEEALCLQIQAQYKWALESEVKEQPDRLYAVVNYYYTFLDKFPNSKYLKTLESVYNTSLEKINNFVNDKNN
ncbi:MAG: outer membrane protein assembly factor BamD [Candidatus Amoebophilus sp.]